MSEKLSNTFVGTMRPREYAAYQIAIAAGLEVKARIEKRKQQENSERPVNAERPPTSDQLGCLLNK